MGAVKNVLGERLSPLARLLGREGKAGGQSVASSGQSVCAGERGGAGCGCGLSWEEKGGSARKRALRTSGRMEGYMEGSSRDDDDEHTLRP